MRHSKAHDFRTPITMLVGVILVASLIATTLGIFSKEGPGQYTYESIHGQNVTIYGKGIYQHMSMELAPQGIAQDVVTLFIGLPLLLVATFLYRNGSFKGKVLLGGTLGYFFLTYLFYLNMAMYSQLFLLYVVLASASFFALAFTLSSCNSENAKHHFTEKTPTGFIGGFLIFNAIAIGFLWLSVVVPPLLNGTIYPMALEHYTTLVVQGFDLQFSYLSRFFPAGSLSRKNRLGILPLLCTLSFSRF